MKIPLSARRLLLWAGVFLALELTRVAAVSAGPALTAPAKKASADIRAECGLMDQALARRDAGAYVAFLHPAFVGVYPQGKTIHGRAEYAASLHQLFALAKTLTSSTQLLTCSLQDGGAVVTTRETGSVSGRNAGRPTLVTRVDVVRSFWVKAAGGRWLKTRERSLSGTMSINGVTS